MELREYIKEFDESAKDFPHYATIVHDNVAEVYLDVNTNGWTSYVGYTTQDWTNFAFATSRIAYLLLLSQLDNVEYNFNFPSRNNRLRSLYPYERDYSNRFYLYIEMMYEFIIGSRIVAKYFLDMCEVPVSEFFSEYQDATFYKDNED